MEITRHTAPFACRDVEVLLSHIFGDGTAPEVPILRGSEARENMDVVYTAYEGDTLLGTVRATIPKDNGTICGISDVCTAPAARGMGLGKRLFRMLTDEVFASGVEAAFLGTSNPVAAKMYRSCGFAFLPGSNVMARFADGDWVDFIKRRYETPPAAVRMVPGGASMRIGAIPLILHRSGLHVLDCNAGQFGTEFATQLACMGVYPRYESVCSRGGRFWGAVGTDKTLGALASVLPTDAGLRADVTWGAAWTDAAAQLLRCCEQETGGVYLLIADVDTRKQKFVTDLGYMPQDASVLNHGYLQLPCHSYRKIH